MTEPAGAAGQALPYQGWAWTLKKPPKPQSHRKPRFHLSRAKPGVVEEPTAPEQILPWLLFNALCYPTCSPRNAVPQGTLTQ